MCARMWLSLCCLLMACQAASARIDEALLTTAERSGFTKTMTYEEVMGVLGEVERRSSVARLISMGTTVEGRAIPLMILADPPITTAQEARASGKTVVFAFGNIHAGEVCGKEALTMLAREIALEPDSPRNRAILDACVVLLAPIYNADGNERFDSGSRPGQNGPETMGQRPNAMGLDLNRDYVKLESPEARAMANLLRAWDPHVVIDTHTTNGSYHRLTLTYEVALNPSAHHGPIDYVRETLLPAVSERVREKTGYETFFYGNFDRAHETWSTYSPLPRFGGQYTGFRNRLSVLTEAHSYATFKDRVLCTKAFVEEIFVFVSEHGEEIRALCARADAEVTRAGLELRADDMVGLRHEIAASEGGKVVIPGYVEVSEDGGRPRPTEELRDYEVTHWDHFEPTLSVRRPMGYLLPAELGAVVKQLRLHGIAVERAQEGRTYSVEIETVDSITRAEREFQGHRNVQVETTVLEDEIVVGEGWWFVTAAQPLGNLVVYLLEARSADGLVTWNFLDEWLGEGRVYPVVRMVSDIVR